MFRPLAWTKTLALAFSSLLCDHAGAGADAAVYSGTAAAESQNPVARMTKAIYLPVLRLVSLRHWKLVVA